jgi:hypothetical protein
LGWRLAHIRDLRGSRRRGRVREEWSPEDLVGSYGRLQRDMDIRQDLAGTTC